MLRRTGIGIFILLGILVSACSSGSSLLGKWETTDETLGATISFEFQNDGVMVMGFEGLTIEGTYQMVDADTFTMAISMLGVEQSTEVDFARAGDTLTLTIEGDPQEFHRVP